MVFNGSCHCKKIQFELKITPAHLTECNCSICYRIGARWAHADNSEVNIICDDSDLINYSWGDKLIIFCSCKHCGCTTHWKSMDAQESTRMAVNTRMMEQSFTKNINVRHFDGADSFEFID